jgi:hypothetical protein
MNSLTTEAMQSWFLVKVAVGLSPILTFGIADIIGWFLRRVRWLRPEVEPKSKAQTRDELAEALGLLPRDPTAETKAG